MDACCGTPKNCMTLLAVHDAEGCMSAEFTSHLESDHVSKGSVPGKANDPMVIDCRE